MNRKSVWDAIQRYKVGHVVIMYVFSSSCAFLTDFHYTRSTHLMEEADALGDVIGIMSHGKMVAEGSSLRLKNTFGVGYNVKLVTDHASTIKGRVKQLMPSARLVDDSAGSLSYSVAQSATSEVPAFFEWVEKLSGADRDVLKDWVRMRLPFVQVR